MKSEILCVRQRGYSWTSDEHSYIKGYLQIKSGEIIKGKRALALFRSFEQCEELINYLQKIYGIYSIIIERENEIWLVTDIAGSIPLYYTSDFSIISDDVEEIRKHQKLEERKGLNSIRVLELYTTSFIGYGNTIYNDIKQVNIGCVVVFNKTTGEISEQSYYKHYSNSYDTCNEQTATDELEEKTRQVIDRIEKVVGKRTLVLSLSSGYDSRYLACSLKDKGIENVICYTYGRSDSFEVVQSKKVAEALGFKWINTVYSDDLVKKLLTDDVEYLDYADRPDYIVYLQNYLAVKHLHDDKLVPEDAIFITGLCNDMPTGFYIPTEEKIKSHFELSEKGVAEYTYNNRFIKFVLTDEAKQFFIKDIIEYLKKMEVSVNDYNSFISALDCIETAGYHTHCYLNMNAVHEFFGYEWLLPCWDRDLLDFWYNQLPEKRIKQSMYEKYIIEQLGKKYGVGTRKHINQPARTPFLSDLKRKIGAVIVKVSYPLHIPLKRNTDINNMAILEVELYKRIRQKKAIKSDRAALILLLTIYIMEYRYGPAWYKRICKWIK